MKPRAATARRILGCLALLCLLGVGADQPARVALVRVPEQGIQPQVAVDGKGTVHLVYFRGEAAHGDLFYARSSDGGATFSRPLQVNRRPGSAIAMGNIRGARLALGQGGRPHVAWMGSDRAEPRGPGNASPMLYTRLNDAGTAFEPERNVIQSAVGLDGGGTIAADELGNVYVAWHAPQPGMKGEANRRVWVAHSKDEGRTFAAEKAVSGAEGCCGCCGMGAFGDRRGAVYVLFRSAQEQVHRDTYLLTSRDHGAGFRDEKLHPWTVATCPMSSFALAENPRGVLAAWESAGQVYFARIDPATGSRSEPIAAPGEGKNRKHPAVATNDRGETILAWTEGMGWNHGGAVAWQAFDPDGKPTAERGRADGVPTWSLVAVFARPGGGFTVLY